MKRQNKELLRINNMINNDRVVLAESFERLFKRDLLNLLNEYFEIKNDAEIGLKSIAGEYIISINAKAKSIKKFKSLN